MPFDTKNLLPPQHHIVNYKTVEKDIVFSFIKKCSVLLLKVALIIFIDLFFESYSEFTSMKGCVQGLLNRYHLPVDCEDLLGEQL